MSAGVQNGLLDPFYLDSPITQPRRRNADGKEAVDYISLIYRVSCLSVYLMSHVSLVCSTL